MLVSFNEILKQRINRQVRSKIANAVAMTLFIAAAMLIMASCQRKPVMAHANYIHLPIDGWQRSMPLTFTPEYDDSLATYDFTLAIRHDNSYPYRNLSLVVDAIAADSVVNRQVLNVPLADEYGNWTGGGFGALYQDKVIVFRNLSPTDARRIVVWQAMEGCDTLSGLVNLGIIVNPR